jgi:polysaccharide biosynthesis protein PslH
MRILWINTELLHPIDKGGKIRSYQMLKRIKEQHAVTYLSFANATADEPFEQASEYCDRLVTVPRRERPKTGLRFYGDLALSAGSSLPYAIHKYRSRAMRAAIQRELQHHHYKIVVCDFLASAINLPSNTKPASVLFQHNVESTIWQRHFETNISPARKAFFYDQWRRMRGYEQAACAEFDAVVAVSEQDRVRLQNDFKLPTVFDVPTGVDTDYYHPNGHARQPFELVFTGSMDWMPNEDAILYFARDILPLVTRSIPDVTLSVVGRNPSRKLIELAASESRIRVTGRVDDIRPYVDRAAVYVVPLRIGGGTRLKIYEAMSMAKPIVTTTIGAEGLPVRDGDELLLADSPNDFADAIVRMLRDPAAASRLGQQARKAVCERFGWQHAASRFMEICENTASTRDACGPRARRRTQRRAA